MFSDERIDWGLHQMETSTERNEPVDNFFITMVTFGDHTLHHLFPSLDHDVIPLLQDTFIHTCEEFGLDMTQKPFASIVHGQFKQLARTTPSAKTKITREHNCCDSLSKNSTNPSDNIRS